MTDIEQRARDALNKVIDERGLIPRYPDRRTDASFEAICRLLEREDALQKQFDDFRQEVSDKVEAALAARGAGTWHRAKDSLASLVIPKSDPWQDVLDELGVDRDEMDAVLAKHGLEIREKVNG